MTAQGLIGARDPVVAERLGSALALAGLSSVYRAESSAAAVTAAAHYRPLVCLLSCCLDGQGLLAVARISTRHPRLPVILVDAEAHADRLRGALRAGAAGYMSATIEPVALARAVESVLAGELAIPREMVRVLVEDVLRAGQRRSSLGHEASDPLTPRQREILRLLARGMSTDGIAEELFLSAATVRSHILRMARALGLSGREALIGYERARAARG